MLTAIDLGSSRQTFLLSGHELGASGAVETLQQALLALSKTGLPEVNPGAVTGSVNFSTMKALVYALPKLKIEEWLRKKITDLAKEALGAVVEEAVEFVASLWPEDEEEDEELSGVDEAEAELKNVIAQAAPALTQAVRATTEARAADSSNLAPSGGTTAKQFLQKHGRIDPTKPTEIAPVAVSDKSSVFAPSSGGSGKTGTYVIAGVAALGLAGIAWWLIR